MREPDANLGVGSGTHAEQTAAALTGIEADLLEHPADLVLVAGDVNSTLAAALAATKLHVAVAHIESGLRSRDWEMPEEVNRVVTDRVSDVLLCTSADAVENLAGEGISGDGVELVGNTMIDSLFRLLEGREPPGRPRQECGEEQGVRARHPAPPGPGRRSREARPDDGGPRRARRLDAGDLPRSPPHAGSPGGVRRRLGQGDPHSADGLRRLHRASRPRRGW